MRTLAIDEDLRLTIGQIDVEERRARSDKSPLATSKKGPAGEGREASGNRLLSCGSDVSIERRVEERRCVVCVCVGYCKCVVCQDISERP